MKRFLTCVLLVAACSKNTPATTTDKPVVDPVPMETATATPADPDAVATLQAYERVRVALAADDLATATTDGKALEGSAHAAANKAPAETSAHFHAIGGEANKLATAADIAAARTAFGEVSRHVVALLVADKALARGHFVFECPMAKGYRKWVQADQQLANPYMGKEMLVCGGESKWE